jgi:hypothetical protein
MIFFASLVFLCFFKTFLMIEARKMTTRDSMGRIAVALDERNSHDTSQLIGDVIREFPTIPHAENMILDAWGNRITIQLENVTDGCEVSCTSAGPDGIAGTDDDIISIMVVLDEYGEITGSVPLADPPESPKTP